MKRMLLVALVAAAFGATAQTVNIGNLSPEEREAIQAAIRDSSKTDAAGLSAKLRGEAAQWADLGTNMGRATVAAARELGMATNDFVATPVGKVTMFVVLYKVIGKDVLGIIAGALTMAMCGGLMIFFLRRRHYSEATYDYRPVLWGLYQKRVMTSFKTSRDDKDEYWTGVFAAAVSLVIGLVVGLNLMF